MTNEEAIKALEQRPCEDWYDVPSDEMTLEQARQAVKDLRKKLAEYLEQHPCEDCISRQAVIDIVDFEDEWLYDAKSHNADTKIAFSTIKSKITALQSVTPRQVKGQWIFDEILDRHYYCSECKSMGVNYWDFCPFCGARMVEPIC